MFVGLSRGLCDECEIGWQSDSDFNCSTILYLLDLNFSSPCSCCVFLPTIISVPRHYPSHKDGRFTPLHRNNCWWFNRWPHPGPLLAPSGDRPHRIGEAARDRTARGCLNRSLADRRTDSAPAWFVGGYIARNRTAVEA